MIRVTIELIPFGDENCKKKLGMIEIANDASGNTYMGNYKVIAHIDENDMVPYDKAKFARICKTHKLPKEEGKIFKNIKNFDRSRSIFDLVSIAIKKCGFSNKR